MPIIHFAGNNGVSNLQTSHFLAFLVFLSTVEEHLKVLVGDCHQEDENCKFFSSFSFSVVGWTLLGEEL
jgi:hypothetical protein